jgi:quercetin dioxygenase-like cupin family protein
MSNQMLNQKLDHPSSAHPVKYVPAGSGPMYWGPGDSVTFLLTGQESRGSCFIVEGLVVPGGGPPPHIHVHEDETFYMLEGEATFFAGGQTIRAKAGDCIHVPRGTVHSVRGEGTKVGRALIIVSPAGPTGMQQFVLTRVNRYGPTGSESRTPQGNRAEPKSA